MDAELERDRRALRQVEAGARVTVTGVGLDPTTVFTLRGGSCGGSPSCRGYEFTADGGQCSVPVVAASARDANKDQDESDAVLTLSGQLRCDPGARQACDEWLDNARQQNGGIGLFAPEGGVAPPTTAEPEPQVTTEDPPPTTEPPATDSTPTPDGTAPGE